MKYTDNSRLINNLYCMIRIWLGYKIDINTIDDYEIYYKVN